VAEHDRKQVIFFGCEEVVPICACREVETVADETSE
jgi:hypothetical protein